MIRKIRNWTKYNKGVLIWVSFLLLIIFISYRMYIEMPRAGVVYDEYVVASITSDEKDIDVICKTETDYVLVDNIKGETSTFKSLKNIKAITSIKYSTPEENLTLNEILEKYTHKEFDNTYQIGNKIPTRDIINYYKREGFTVVESVVAYHQEDYVLVKDKDTVRIVRIGNMLKLFQLDTVPSITDISIDTLLDI